MCQINEKERLGELYEELSKLSVFEEVIKDKKYVEIKKQSDNLYFIFSKEDKCCEHKFIYRDKIGKVCFDQYMFDYYIIYNDVREPFVSFLSQMCRDMFERKEYIDVFIKSFKKIEKVK